MATGLIGQRLKALREEKGLSQEGLAQIFGFKDRQTVSAIENGERKLSADELLRAVRELDTSIDYFTDPFCLVGEGRFNWRQASVSSAVLNSYQRKAGQMIAAFRALAAEMGERPALMRHALTLSRFSRFEDASRAGERFAIERRLGAVPASRLIEVMESDLSLLVLMVDPSDDGISGAACRLPELDVILINRREPLGRRHFDLAHELFHILTWDALPPPHVEDVSTGAKKPRIEQLADAFAAALLMPAKVVEAARNWGLLAGQALADALNSVADRLQVTSIALFWRIVALGLLNKLGAQHSPPDGLRHNGRSAIGDDGLPPLFSRRFMDIMGRAIEEGRISIRRLSGLLDVDVDDLGEIFSAHGLRAPYAL